MKRSYRKRVVMEPVLEHEAGHLSPEQRENLADVYERFAKQLRLTAVVLRRMPEQEIVTERMRYVRTAHLN